VVHHQIQCLIFASQPRDVSLLYRTSHAFQTLKNIFKVLHKLHWLMKNDMQIAFTDLRFQPSSGKFVTIIQYPKPISWNVWIRILSS